MPKVLDYSVLIVESVSDLLLLEKSHKKSYLRDRVRFLRFLKEGSVKSQSAAGNLIGISSRQSKNLWSKYKSQGISYFEEARINQNWGKLSSVQISQLLQYLDQDHTASQKEVQQYIKDNFAQEFSQPGIHYLFKRLKVKLKTGRPSNIKKDEKEGEAFKKKLPLIQSEYGKEQIYFEDEMRYATRTECKRRWTRQGKRPKCKVKIGYEWGWLYVAICPQTGDMIASFISHLDKECFSMFANQFQNHLEKQNKNGTVLMIADGATAHQPDCLPEQIKLLKLPRASPDLNPVERFFAELRRPLSNRVFENKKQVENALDWWVKEWRNDPNRLIKLTNFSWIKGEN